MSTPFFQSIQNIPNIGFGIGMQNEYYDDILPTAQPPALLEWIELIPENFMGKGRQTAQNLDALIAKGYPLTSHGVGLSLGSVDPINPIYLTELTALFETINPLWFSDHLSFSSVNGRYLNDLIPLPFTAEAVQVCADKIKFLQDKFQRPFLIENDSTYARFPSISQYTEADFMRAIVETADCGILLDVNNIFVNCQNHQENGEDFVAGLPLERVVEIHIAGHLATDSFLIDTHGEPICDEVFALLAAIYPQCPNLKGVLLERDTNIPPFETLMSELQQVKTVALASVKSKVGSNS
jgi:uncharacterized protein (UPF0276 family)